MTNKEATLEKIIDIVVKWHSKEPYPPVRPLAKDILKLISKEIKKNRPKEKKPYAFPFGLRFDYNDKDRAEVTGFNQALKDYDEIIADTLGEEKE